MPIYRFSTRLRKETKCPDAVVKYGPHRRGQIRALTRQPGTVHRVKWSVFQPRKMM